MSPQVFPTWKNVTRHDEYAALPRSSLSIPYGIILTRLLLGILESDNRGLEGENSMLLIIESRMGLMGGVGVMEDPLPESREVDPWGMRGPG